MLWIAAGLLAPASFASATFIAYWSGWQTITTQMIALLVGYGFMGSARWLHLDLDPPRIEWHLGGVGPFKDVLVGGRGELPLWWDMVCLAARSLVVYAGAMVQGCRVGAPLPSIGATAT